MTHPATAARRRQKLVVLATHPIQYYAPLYRLLAMRGIVDIEVIYLSDAGAKPHEDPDFSRTVQWDVPLLEGYDYQMLQPGTPINARGFWQLHDRKLLQALEHARPDWLLVYGYACRMNWVAARWAHRRGIKVAYSSDSNIRSPERMVPVKALVLKAFFRYVDLFLAPSERNEEYLLKYGAARHKIQRIPFAIDTARFTPPRSNDSRRHDFIWAGKFAAWKRGVDFLAALDICSRRTDRCIHACMVGDGPLRDALHAQARQLPPHCHVEFTGFVNQGGMPEVLRSADTLVLTSDIEAYGLVATEAAASGLALIVADAAGCVGDTVLARPGVNTLTFKVGDTHALANAMETLLQDAGLRQRMQHASLDIAKYHDVACAAEVIEQLITEGLAK
jgi:glycosyltransferase involved in cell wall biosynthesis